MKFGARLARAFDRLLDSLAWISCALIAFQFISVSLEVLVRYFFGFTFGWVTALNEWSLVFITFLGAAWLQREGGHTSDDSIISLLPAWVKRVTDRLGWILAVVTCGMLVWYGTKVTLENFWNETYDFFKIREVPVAYVYAVIPFGSLLWMIQLLRTWRRDPHKDEESEVPSSVDI